MIANPRWSIRPGYTLLEVLVASVIALILLGALYATFDLVLTQSTGGRDMAAESELSRSIINRVGIDLTSCIGTLPPKSGGNPNASGGSSSTESSSTATAAAATTETVSTDGTTTEAAAATTTSDTPFQAGVIGGGSQITMFASKLPKYLRNRFAQYDPTAQDGSDLMRVTYYLHSSGYGLCRQERPWVTADGIWNSVDPDRSTESEDIIAPEVTSVSFEFASGTGFTSSWDGAQGATDGTTNQGPPRAIRMTFEIEVQVKNGTTAKKAFTHTYAIRAATGLIQSAAASTDTAATDTTSTATTSP